MRVGCLLAFDEMRAEVRRSCDLESNMSKVKAFSPVHGNANVPLEILTEQGTEPIVGFKCVGSFILRPPRTKATSGGRPNSLPPSPRASPTWRRWT